MCSARQDWLRVPATPLREGELTLSDEASHYVVRVHRRKVGEQVLLFDPSHGTEAVADIMSVQGKRITCRAAEVRVGTRRGIEGLHLVQGLGKGDKPEQVVRDGVALGVQTIRFVVCERSVAQTTARDSSKLERLVRIATEAARQSGRSNLPAIELGVDFEQAAASGAHTHHGIGAKNELALVLQPGDQWPLVEVAVNAARARDTELRVAVWVGPEGGFTARELAMLTQNGASKASLGDLVLRTELAAVVALARIGACLSTSH